MTLHQVLTDVLRREGWPAVTRDAADLGGLTKGGVTFASYNRWRASHRERPLTADEFVEITEDEARTFFEDEFARPFAFVTDEALYALLVDWCVNAGPDDPARALQAALKERDAYRGTVDGVPGPLTRTAWLLVAGDVNAVRSIERSVLKARILFHVDRSLDQPARAFIRSYPTTQLKWLRGWINRAVQFLD